MDQSCRRGSIVHIHTHTCGDTCSVKDIIVRNGHCEPSSNHGQGLFNISHHPKTLGKCMNPTSFYPAMGE